MKTIKSALFAAIAALALFVCAPLPAQQTATVHGTVTDPVGAVVPSGDVKFTLDKGTDPKDAKFLYSFPLDSSGNYKGTVAPGDYEAFVYREKVIADFQEVVVKAGEDKTANFDMTREEYIKTLTPEQQKQIEELKKKNAAAMSTNKVVANLNATLKTVREDMAAAAKTHADVSKDVDMMKQATQSKPDEALLWITYGQTLQAQADSMAAADRAAHKPSQTDDAVTKEYSDAIDAYQKSIDLSTAAKKADPALLSTAYNQMGTAYGKMGKLTEASAAYDNAVKQNPSKAGMYYGNEAVNLFNAGQADAALAAAEKAIAADPTEPDPYFIKGQALITKATLDPKTQKLVAPPGCVEAYQKFLQLTPDPNNEAAQTAKDVLQGLGEKIDTSYRAGAPKKK